jgi:hypothetical protein
LEIHEKNCQPYQTTVKFNENYDMDQSVSVNEYQAVFDQDSNDFRLDNSNSKLNCFANAILQVIWNIDALKMSIQAYSKIKSSDKNTREHKIVDCVLEIFQQASDAISE